MLSAHYVHTFYLRTYMLPGTEYLKCNYIEHLLIASATPVTLGFTTDFRSLEEEDDDGRNADSERTLVISNCLCYPDRHTNSGEEAGMRAERNLNTSRSVFNFLQDF
nr:uncharacterized protein LOC128692960 isoform X1 [Cherax quadricarinatus]